MLHAVTISKAAILGIALGALVVLLMILVAACRPHNHSPYPDGSLDKPGTLSSVSNSLCCIATLHSLLGFLFMLIEKDKCVV